MERDPRRESPAKPKPQAVAPSKKDGQKGGKGKGIGIVVAIVIVVVAIIAIVAVVVSGNVAKSDHEARAAEHPVTVMVAADGYAPSDSRIPVQVTGTDGNGDTFDQLEFVASDGTGLSVPQGEYTLTIMASPLTASGAVYAVPAEKITLSVPGGLGAGETYAASVTIKLVVVAALDMTDQQLADAATYAAKDADFDQTKIETYKAAAQKAHQNAVEAKAAADAQAAAEEAARVAAEQAAVKEAEKQSAISQATAAGKQVVSGTIVQGSFAAIAASKGVSSSNMGLSSDVCYYLQLDESANLVVQNSGGQTRPSASFATGSTIWVADSCSSYAGQSVVMTFASSEIGYSGSAPGGWFTLSAHSVGPDHIIWSE